MFFVTFRVVSEATYVSGYRAVGGLSPKLRDNTHVLLERWYSDHVHQNISQYILYGIHKLYPGC